MSIYVIYCHYSVPPKYNHLSRTIFIVTTFHVTLIHAHLFACMDAHQSLVYMILAKKKANQRGHITGHSRLSDQPSRRSESRIFWLFYKKVLGLYRNQPAIRAPLSGNFGKNLSENQPVVQRSRFKEIYK